MPTWTALNVRLGGAAVRIAGVTPVPESAMSTAVVDPLTIIDRFPLLLPADVGEKRTANVLL